MRGQARTLIALAAVACSTGCSPPGPGAPDASDRDGLAVESVRFRGHHEASLRRASGPESPVDLVPLVYGTPPIGLCVEAPTTTDTTTWRAALHLEGEPPPEPSAAVARAGRNLCFDGPSPAAEPAPGSREGARLCGTLVDLYDDRQLVLPCRDFLRSRTPEDPMKEPLGEAIREAASRGAVASLPRFDALAARAEELSRPFYALRIRLIAVHFLRQEGSDEAADAARELLREAPEWLHLPAATGWRAQVHYQRAGLALATGRLRDGWRSLTASEGDYRRVADPLWLSVAQRRAIWMARLGAPREAIETLGRSIDACSLAPCAPALLASAQRTLGWLIVSDPAATPEALESAEELLTAELETGWTDESPAEIANRWINIGLRRARLAVSPAAALAEVSSQLDALGPAPLEGRALEISLWSHLVEATYHLERGDSQRALESADGARSETTPEPIDARALGLMARAHQRLGNTAAADRALGVALVLHENASDVEGTIDPGPSDRVADFYRAARTAIELGDPAEAWHRLSRLDSFTEAPDCGADTKAPTLRAERARLLEELHALEVPASSIWREARAPIQRTLRDRLREIARSLAESRGCAARWESAAARDPLVRAFASDGEVFLLEQRPSGAVELLRRTPLPAAELTRAIDGLARAAENRVDDPTWSRAAEPLARALLPPLDRIGPRTRIAAYGALQAVPFAALPTGDPDRPWLADRTTVIVRQSDGAVRADASLDLTSEPGLFVVDPRSNLAAARELAPTYRRLFPQATLLSGSAATRESTLTETAQSRWIHIDAHGEFDPAFPELTRLLLADRSLDVLDLVERPDPLAFANLSGCDTGSAGPRAASSGYGLAGLLARLGAQWVVASRDELADSVAGAFNGAFYAQIAAGDGIPDAFTAALDITRAARPASEWASILLLEGPGRGAAAVHSASRSTEDPMGGQSHTGRTPRLVGAQNPLRTTDL